VNRNGAEHVSTVAGPLYYWQEGSSMREVKGARALGILMIVGLLLSGCGGGQAADEETGAASDPAATSEEDAASPAESEQTGDVEEFCNTAVEAIAVVGAGPEVDFETASPEQIEEALAAFAEQATPLLEDLQALAPEEISGDVDTLVTLVNESLEGGEPPFEEPEFIEADTALDEYMLAECGFSDLEVAGVDYAYEGLADTIETGTYGLTFSNEGGEVHEFFLFRLSEDAASLEELLALPEDDPSLQEQLTFVSAAFAPPGERDVTFLEIADPGRYAAVCFITQGTTSLEQLEEEPPPGESPAPDASPPGPPHFTLGMSQEFTVE
jgi:hypothetical protein